MTRKRKKTPEKNSSQASKDLRNSAITAKIIAGEKVNDVAKEMGLHPSTVSDILNSDDQKKVVKKAQKKVLDMVDEALETFRDAMQSRSLDMASALKAATLVLKNYAIIREKIEVEHSQAKPTVIVHPNGEIEELRMEKGDEDVSN